MAGYDIRKLAQANLNKKRCDELLHMLWTNAAKGDLNAVALYLELAGYLKRDSWPTR